MPPSRYPARTAFVRVRVERLVMREARLLIASKPDSASFTACEVGNAFAFSGDSNTTVVPFVTSAWNFPRSNFAKSERLYSGRISTLALFIEFPLAARHTACTENSNSTRSVRVVNCNWATET